MCSVMFSAYIKGMKLYKKLFTEKAEFLSKRKFGVISIGTFRLQHSDGFLILLDVWIRNVFLILLYIMCRMK